MPTPDFSTLNWPSKLAILADGVRAGIYPPSRLCRQFWPKIFVDSHQQDIIRSVIRGRYGMLQELAIKGCTGSGKGCSVAIAANIWFELCDTAKIIVTSVSYEKAVDVMFAEIIKWRKAMQVPHEGEINTTQIKVNEEKWMRVINPATGEGFSGVHGENVLLLCDEASGVRSDFWELGKTQAKLRVAISNPRILSGWFYDLFPEAFRDSNKTFKLPSGAKRRIITIDAGRCWNVRTGTNHIPGQITREQFAEIMANPNPMWGQVFGHGRFPDEDLELQLIGMSWLRRHFAAWKRMKDQVEVQAFGVDIADSKDGDETVLAAGGMEGVAGLHARRKKGTMATVGWIVRVALSKYGIDLTVGDVPVCVDADGIGAGVASRLEELGAWVIAHHGSDLAEDKRNYRNCRTETWCLLAVRLDPAGPFAAVPWALPRNEKLALDLCAQERRFDSDPTRVSLMPKEKRKVAPGQRSPDDDKCVRSKLGRSPDRGDAVSMLYRAVRLLVDEDAMRGVVPGEAMATQPEEIDAAEKEYREAKVAGKLNGKRQPKPKSTFDKEIDDLLELYDEVGRGPQSRRSRWDDLED